jgi:hypothetical protein
MCGLVGTVGNIFLQERKAFKQLLTLDAFRGEDSTGIAAISTKNVIHVDKELGHPFYLLSNGGKEHPFLDNEGVTKNDFDVLIGHNRSATVGKKTADNAHPFIHGSIVGAHNGTLTAGNPGKLDDYYKFDVDSEAVIFNISKYGPEAIKKVAGAYALVWYDQTQQKLFFIRNHERPLYYTRREDKDAFFWASEKWMLTVCLDRNHIKHGEIKEFTANKLHSLDCSDTSMKFRNVEMEVGETILGFTLPPSSKKATKHGGNHQTSQGTGGSSQSWSMYTSGQTKGGYTAHINPFRNNTSVEAKFQSAWDIAALKRLCGSAIDFTITGDGIGQGGTEYLIGKSVIPTDDFQIRIYKNSAKVKEYTDLEGTTDIWNVKLKKTVKFWNKKSGKHEIYLLTDMRTLKKSKDKIIDYSKAKEGMTAVTIPLIATSLPPFLTTSQSNDKLQKILNGTDPLIGFGGRYLSTAEWWKVTKQGCGNCGCTPMLIEHDFLTWIGHSEFICPDCKDLDHVKPYVNNTVMA